MGALFMCCSALIALMALARSDGRLALEDPLADGGGEGWLGGLAGGLGDEGVVGGVQCLVASKPTMLGACGCVCLVFLFCDFVLAVTRERCEGVRVCVCTCKLVYLCMQV